MVLFSMKRTSWRKSIFIYFLIFHTMKYILALFVLALSAVATVSAATGSTSTGSTSSGSTLSGSTSTGSTSTGSTSTGSSLTGSTSTGVTNTGVVIISTSQKWAGWPARGFNLTTKQWDMIPQCFPYTWLVQFYKGNIFDIYINQENCRKQRFIDFGI